MSGICQTAFKSRNGRSASDISRLLAIADELASRGDFCAAEDIYLQIAESEPICTEAQRRLSEIYSQRGDFSQAINLLSRGLQAAPLNGKLTLYLLRTLISANLAEHALKLGTAYLEQVPTDSEIRKLLQEINVHLYGHANPLEAGLTAMLAALAPGKKIVLGHLFSERIGELALRADLFLRRRQLSGQQDDTAHVFVCRTPANRQLLKMFQRHMNIIENPQLLDFLLQFDSFKRMNDALPVHSNEYHEFNTANVSLRFTAEEEAAGREHLTSMGIGKNDWFVCIYARDQRYLNDLHPEKDTSYHDYRNADINTYQKAAEYIVSQGGFVIRMGSSVEKPLAFQHERVIDYATNGRSDFMDIFLTATCRFFIGTPAGICDVATVFNVPFVGVNVTPPGYAPISRNAVYIPKKVRRTDTGKYVPFPLLFSRFRDKSDPAVLDGNNFSSLGLQYEDNTPDEILDVTREMLERLEGRNQPNRQDLELMEKYFGIFPEDHFARPIKTSIGLDFLKNNAALFFEDNG